MARLVTCGFETGDFAEAGIFSAGGGISATLNTSTPSPRLGGRYCIRFNITAVGWNGCFKQFMLPAPVTDLWARCGFFPHTDGQGMEVSVMGWFDSTGAAQACVTFNVTDRLFRIRLGSGVGGTLLATATGAGWALDVWHCVEMRWQATSTTTGIIEIWVDGTQAINFSGDNTNTTNVNVQSVWYGVGTSTNNGSGSTCYWGFDDIVVNDTTGLINNGRPGDGRVVLLTPSATGASTAFTRGGTDTGANFSQVNEIPPSMTQYVASGTVTNRDLYNLTDLPLTAQSVNSVEEIVLAQNNEAGTGSIGLTIQSGSTVSETTAQALSTAQAYYTSRWETDPNTGAAWTGTAVNALQAGVTVR